MSRNMTTIDGAGHRGVTRDVLLMRARRLLPALLLLVPTLALADAKSEARRHYRDGMALITAGQSERGIEELKAAYAIRPHPDVLYNIAKAYLDTGNIGEALNYFRKYAATDPEDRSQVEGVIERLSKAAGQAAAAASNGTTSAEAPATISTPNGPIDANVLLQQLAELIARSKGQPATGATVASAAPAPGKPGVKPASGGKQPAGAAPAVVTPAPAAAPGDEDMFEAQTLTAKATAKEISQELSAAGGREDETLFEEQVVTAGIRASTEEKAPASLTVISEEEIRMSGAATVPEILRRVPGIDIAEMNASDTNISIRGFNRRVSNKVLVLVDGRSVYQDFLGNTFWPLLNVAMGDIARIEVIRGPGSALYGANAFAGVVNIITKVGEKASGARAFLVGGTHNTFQGGFTMGGKAGKFGYRTSVGYDRADKWTRDAPDDRADLVPQFAQTNRSRDVQRADVAASYDGSGYQINAGGGFNQMAIEIMSIGALRTFNNEGQSGYARMDITSGPTKVKAFWNSLRMLTGPQYWPNNIASLNSHIRSDVFDLTAQTGVDFKAGGTHHFSFGAGYRYKTVNWEYLASDPNGTNRHNESEFNAFVQEEWQPSFSKKLSFVASYRVDRPFLLAQLKVTPGGLVHSPRATMLYAMNPDNVLRFTIGSAFRAATFLESYADLFAPVPQQPAVGVRFEGRPDLQPEFMLQGEVGYRGRIGERFQPDIVAYVERVTNLITDGAFTQTSPGTAVDSTGNYIIAGNGFQNESSKFYGFGIEAGGKFSPADGVDLALNYAFERLADCTSSCNFDFTTPSQTSLTLGATPQHKVNFLASWRTKVGFDLEADVHFVSDATWFEKTFDPSVSGGVRFDKYYLSPYALINGRVGYRFIKDKLEAGVAAYNLLDDGHREHPFGNQIGRRFLATISGSF